jgi:hypothetical protein
MKLFRSYISKLLIITLVCSGLMTAMVQPTEAARPANDFAYWLESVTKAMHAPEVEQALNELKQLNTDIDELIHKASQIVSRHNSEFNLPLGESSKDVSTILLLEWNQYQNGNSMTAVPPAPTVKPLLSPSNFKILTGTHSVFKESKKPVYVIESSIFNLQAPSGNHFYIIPMQGGTAIAAP